MEAPHFSNSSPSQSPVISSFESKNMVSSPGAGLSPTTLEIDVLDYMGVRKILRFFGHNITLVTLYLGNGTR